MGERGSKVYTLAVPAGEKVVVRTFSASGVESSGNETLYYSVARNGTLNILVYAYKPTNWVRQGGGDRLLLFASRNYCCSSSLSLNLPLVTPCGPATPITTL